MSAPTLAELLAEHMLYDRYEGPQCSCGAAVLTSSLLTTHRGQWHRAHLAAVIEDSDWLRERIDHADEEGARWQDRAERAEAERDGWHEAFNDRLAELQGYAGGIAEAEAERDAAREALARVEALADAWEGIPLDQHLIRYEVPSEALRAALAQPEDEGAGAAKCVCGHAKSDHRHGVGECLERDRSLPCGCKTYEARP